MHEQNSAIQTFELKKQSFYGLKTKNYLVRTQVLETLQTPSLNLVKKPLTCFRGGFKDPLKHRRCSFLRK